jgi:hypothetical protein
MAATVTLIDGREVSTYSEEWRIECEARAVCKLRTRMHRHDYMERVRSRRGADAHKQLWDLVLQIWNAEFRVK